LLISREAFGQAIPPKSLQDEIDKDSRFGRHDDESVRDARDRECRASRGFQEAI
jgi:hypothetical protein